MAAKKKAPRASASPPPAPPVAKPPSETPAPERPRQPAQFAVVGIVASAGGLEAFKKFFTAMPADSGVAFVLVPHLDPTHESLMVELLGRLTTMPVDEATEGLRVEPNHVYVIPPNRDLALRHGALRLTAPKLPRGSQTSIDFFLRSLADDQRERAVGIVLSGTGAHGTLGLKAIKANGGLTMVQEPATAQHDQMPRSAVAAGLADYVLAPERMPEALVRYLRHPYLNSGAASDLAAEAADHLQRILAVLGARTKFDFRCYRKKMLVRRIERRMGLLHLDQVARYLDYLREHPDEVQQLAKDLLISVTSFFREPEAFEVLATQVLPELLQQRAADTPLRVWVAGCATGEEAYSLTMLLLEQLAAAHKNCPLQVFASDLDESALAVARLGVYPDSIADDVSPERLARFFTRAGEHTYQVAKQLREPIIFAAQNLITDAPFSRLDLISCRNVLIYLEPELQKKIIPLFHFALNEGGFLLLGPSETIGRQGDLFEPVSKKWRVYRRVAGPRSERVDFPITPRGQAHAAVRPRVPPGLPQPNFAELTRQVLLEEFEPAAVLVNHHFEILYYHGLTSRYLHQPAGEPTQDLLRMARDGLRVKLRAALHKASREAQRVVVPRVRFKHDGASSWVRLTVKPVPAPPASEGLLLVLFEQEPAAAREPDDTDNSESLERQLEYELQAARQDLLNTIEELESSSEELKSSNEEVMSMNEELQSANEELETSKEELQSLNEELSTVNSQLQDKIEELERTNNDLANLLVSTDIATVFLDTEFRVKRFTPATTRLLSLLPSDVGRPLGDFARKFADGDLLRDVAQVLHHLTPLEKEVHTEEGRVYLRRIVPYRTLDNKVEGVVLTFADVTRLKEATERQRRLATVLLDSNDAVTVQDFSGRLTAWNHSAERMYGYTEAEALALNAEQLVPPELRAEAAALLERLRCGERVDSWETRRLCKDGHTLDVWVTLTTLRDETGQPVAVASTERDITERKLTERIIRELNATLEERIAERTSELEATNRSLQSEIAERRRAEAALRESSERLAAVVNTAAEGIITLTADGTVDSFNKAAERMFGYPAAAVIGRPLDALLPSPEGKDNFLTSHLTTGDKKGVGIAGRLLGCHQDGSTFPVDLSIGAVSDGGDQRVFTAIVRDISETQALEREVLEVAAAEQQRIGQDLHDSVGQELTGLALMAESLADTFSDKTLPGAATALKIVGGVRRALKQVRALSRGLIPVEVDSEGLMVALAGLAERTGELSGRTCTFTCEEPVLVDDNATATHLYHIAQEAVTNALKHSRSRYLEISLTADGQRLTLVVRDDGVGPPSPGEEVQGMGLKIMRYRAGLINAALTIGPAAGGGTEVRCVLRRGDSHGRKTADARNEERPRPDR